MSMIQELERIKTIISKAENQKARAEGIVEKIESEWTKKYGTGSLDEIKEKYSELQEESKVTSARKESLFQKLLNGNDWDKLEEELA